MAVASFEELRRRRVPTFEELWSRRVPTFEELRSRRLITPTGPESPMMAPDLSSQPSYPPQPFDPAEAPIPGQRFRAGFVERMGMAAARATGLPKVLPIRDRAGLAEGAAVPSPQELAKMPIYKKVPETVGRTAVWLGKLAATHGLLKGLGILTTQAHPGVLSRAWETAKWWGGTEAIQQGAQALGEAAFPEEYEYKPQKIFTNAAWGFVFSLGLSGIGAAGRKLFTPSEKKLALRMLKVKKGASQEEIWAASQKLAAREKAGELSDKEVELAIKLQRRWFGKDIVYAKAAATRSAPRPQLPGMAETPVKPTAIAPPAPAKEPWAVRREEYVKSQTTPTGYEQYRRDLALRAKGEATTGFAKRWDATHAVAVQDALAEGKPVPRHVLSEYKSEKWAQEALAKEPTKDAKSMIRLFDAHTQVQGGLKRGLVYYRNKLEQLPEDDLKVLLEWARSDDRTPWINRFVKDEIAAVMRSKGLKPERTIAEALARKPGIQPKVGAGQIEPKTAFEKPKPPLEAIKPESKAPGQEELPSRPLVNPKASALQRDKQLRQQQAWDRKYRAQVAAEGAKARRKEIIQARLKRGEQVGPKVLEEFKDEPWAKAALAEKPAEKKAVEAKAAKPKERQYFTRLLLDERQRLLNEAKEYGEQFNYDWLRKEYEPRLTAIDKDLKSRGYNPSSLPSLKEYVKAEHWLPKPVPKAKGGARPGFPRAPAVGRPRMPTAAEPISTKPPVSAREIITHLSVALGVPYRGMATHRPKAAAGWYFPKERGIRQVNVRALSTAAHEAGHHIDHFFKIRQAGVSPAGRKTYKLPVKGVARELEALGKALYGDRKPPGGYRSEGIAEFVRGYLTEHIDVAKQAPNFYRWFTEDYLPNNPEVGEALKEAKKLITDWRSQGAQSRIESQINRRETLGTPGDIAKRTNLWFHTMFVDEFTPLRNLVRQAEKEAGGEIPPSENPYDLAVFFSQKEGARARQMVVGGTVDLWGRKTGPGLKEIVAPVARDIKRFTRWVVAYRSLDLIKRGIEPGISQEDADFLFRKYDSPEWRAVADEITQWNHRVLDYLVQAGGLEKRAADKIKQMNPIYIPFMRAFTKGEISPGLGAGKGVVTTAKGVHKIKGSGREIIDPFESMVQNTRRILSIAHKSAVARALGDMEEGFGGLGDLIWKVPAPLRATIVQAEQVKKQLMKAGVEFTEAGLEETDALLTVYTNSPIYMGKDNVICIVRKGKRQFYEVAPELYRVLKGLDQFYLPKVLDIVFGKPTRMVKLGATGINAAFSLVRNPIRDSLQLIVTGKHAQWGPFSSVRGIAQDLTTSELSKMLGVPESEAAEHFMALGGKMSGFIGMDRSSTKHLRGEMLASNIGGYAIQTARHPLDAMRELFSIPEAGPRTAEFENALKAGEKKYGRGSPDAVVYAFNAAQDVTINFSRHGHIGKFLNGITAFFNAGVQDISKLHRTFRERPVEAMLKGLAFLTIPAIYLWWRNKDKQWYRNLPAYEKANYVHFEVPGEQTIVRLPVPFTIGHIFMAIPVAVLDSHYRNDPSTVKKVFAESLEQDFPGNWPPWPSAIAPVIQTLMNKDWAGRPIVSQSVAGKLPEDQYHAWNTKLSREIGLAINFSPAKLDYLLNAYSGGLYRRTVKITERALSLEDKEATKADWPLIGTLFVRDPYAPKAQIEAFYERKEYLDRLYRSRKINLSQLVERRLLTRVNNGRRYPASWKHEGLTHKWKRLRQAKTVRQRERIYWEITYWLELTERTTKYNKRLYESKQKGAQR